MCLFFLFHPETLAAFASVIFAAASFVSIAGGSLTAARIAASIILSPSSA